MSSTVNKLGIIGMLIGTCALLLALASFLAGPFASPRSLEAVLEEKAEALRLTAMDVLNGKKPAKSYNTAPWDIDRIITLAIPLLGVLAIVLGLFSYAVNQPVRIAGAAAILGASAIGLQLVARYWLS